jgi:hypothetical protein
MSEVRSWLEAIGLPQYADAFEANEIDIDLLEQVEDVSPHAWGCPMEDRPDLQIDGLDAANRAFNLREAFIGPDGRTVVEHRSF